MIIVLSNQISAWLWSPVCFYVMQIISCSLLLYYITLSVIFSLEVFLSAQTVGTLCYSQQSHYKVKTCRQVWFLKTKPVCNDAFCKHIYQTAWPLDYFTVSMRLCLFPTSGTMSQPVLVCMQEASEYICISLKGDNEEMLQNQHVCGLTTACAHVCARERVTWLLSAVRQADWRICVLSEIYLLSDVQL